MLLVWDLNQVNPSIKIENCDGFMPQDRDGSAFPSSCHLQPICNHLQPELTGMVKNHIFSGFTPIFTDFTGVKPPYVGSGTSGKPLPLQSHLKSRGFESLLVH
jgi:hypothetical protein